MRELLLADTNQLSASLSECEVTRQQIENAEYKTFTLSEADGWKELIFDGNETIENRFTKVRCTPLRGREGLIGIEDR